ncbi:phosphotransferase family protein [Devosia sp.]|uniref:phosphotransferase family protein n=1 Tax=Devosia sp. TaxID=1871048 RepID=UPI002FCA3E66
MANIAIRHPVEAIEVMLGQRLGAGLVAEVFEWGTDAIKLYQPGRGKEQVFREAATLAMLEHGPLPVPRVRGVLETNGRWGVVMSRAPGRPIAAEMLEHPGDARAMLDEVVRLQLRIHSEPGLLLPRLRDRLRGAIARARQLSADEIGATLQLVESLPDGDRLCHGDFHPFNVMGTPEAPMIIDWLDATQGAPEADACRSYLLLLHNVPDVAATYLDAYVRLSGRAREAVLAWLPVLAAARLVEQVPGEHERLAALVRSAL